MFDAEQWSQLLQGFLEEARDLLKEAEDSLLRLEANYRRGGLTAWERQDLDRRYDRLSAKVRYERNDHNGQQKTTQLIHPSPHLHVVGQHRSPTRIFHFCFV